MMDECRAWLESYREALLEANRLSSGQERLWSQATSTVSKLSNSPRGGGGDSGLLLAALADALGESEKRRAEAERRRLEIEAFIDGVEGDLCREILRLRYVEMLSWPKIKAALEKSGVYYEERQIYRLHGKALTSARTKWREERK